MAGALFRKGENGLEQACSARGEGERGQERWRGRCTLLFMRPDSSNSHLSHPFSFPLGCGILAFSSSFLRGYTSVRASVRPSMAFEIEAAVWAAADLLYLVYSGSVRGGLRVRNMLWLGRWREGGREEGGLGAEGGRPGQNVLSCVELPDQPKWEGTEQNFSSNLPPRGLRSGHEGPCRNK